MQDRRITPWRALSFALAALVLAAAGLKLHQLLTAPLLGDGWLDSRWFITAVIETELLIGLWLLSGLLPHGAWRVSLVLFALFMLFALVRAVSGAASCGCFGQVTINPWLTALFDAAVICLLLCCRPARVDVPLPGPQIMPQCLTVVLLWLLLGSAAATAVASHRPTRLGDVGQLLSDGRTVVLEPESWVGKRFPLLDWIDIDADLTQGEWTVVFYRGGCNRCKQLLQKFERHDVVMESDAVAFVALGRLADSTPKLVRGARYGHLAGEYEWFVAGPLVLQTHDGLVTAIDSLSQETPQLSWPDPAKFDAAPTARRSTMVGVVKTRGAEAS